MDFPGSITLTCPTMAKVIMEICESLYAHGVDKFIFVNGHGHNGPSINIAMDEFKQGKEVFMVLIPWWIAGGKLTKELWDYTNGNLPDGHAADIETSGVLAINKDLVDMTRAGRVVLGEVGGTKIKFHKSTAVSLGDYPIEMTTVSDFKKFTDTGLIGGALNATAEKGEKVLEAISDYLAELIREMKKALTRIA